MLNVLAHHGPIEPSQLWSGWNGDPLVWIALVLPSLAYIRLWPGGPNRAISRWRRRAFLAGIAAAAVALVSPLDALSGSLASAHMVQHLLLTTVAAPLLVVGVHHRSLLAGLPPTLRRRARRWRTRLAATGAPAALEHPVVASLPYVAALWFWHARTPYEAALDEPLLHALEHASLMATALLSWAAIFLTTRRYASHTGTAVLVLFGLALQSGLLGVLLSFAREPWYGPYSTTTEAWGLTALADQQLAGVVMWVPGGISYLVVAVALLVTWIGLPERRADFAAAVTSRAGSRTG